MEDEIIIRMYDRSQVTKIEELYSLGYELVSQNGKEVLLRKSE